MSAPAGEGQATAQQQVGATGDGQQPAQTPATPPVVPPGAQTAVQQASAAQQATQVGEQHAVDDLPDWAQKIVRDARAEAASSRTNAKQQAADQARAELAQQIGKALGLVQDEQVDPAKLTEQLTASQAAQTEAARELAVFKAAAGAGADPARLLDSRSFLQSIADTDPTDAAKIAELVKIAVDTNPTFRTTPAPGASAVDHAGGSGEGHQPRGRAQKTMAEAVANTLRLN